MRKTTQLFFLLAAVAAIGSASSEVLGLFEARAQIKMRLETSQTAPLDLNEINVIESATARYFGEILKNPDYESLPEQTQVASTHVTVTKNSFEAGSVQTEAEISVTHLGEAGIEDLAVILLFVTNLNVTGASYSSLDELLVGINVKVSNLSFVAGSTTVLIDQVALPAVTSSSKYSDSEITLIAVCSILSFALLVMSAILIWVAGGWLALRKQVKVLIHREEELSKMYEEKQHQIIQERPTVDEADEESQIEHEAENETQITNASGILGVRNPYQVETGRSAMHGLGVKMTPSKSGPNSVDDSGIYTPMSEATNATSFSDTNRAPLGITSMRKLLPSADDEKDTLDNTLNNFRIEKLQF